MLQPELDLSPLKVFEFDQPISQVIELYGDEILVETYGGGIMRFNCKEGKVIGNYEVAGF
jgi:hypothetical protein